jgi:hypothetical protein
MEYSIANELIIYNYEYPYKYGNNNYLDVKYNNDSLVIYNDKGKIMSLHEQIKLLTLSGKYIYSVDNIKCHLINLIIGDEYNMKITMFPKTLKYLTMPLQRIYNFTIIIPENIIKVTFNIPDIKHNIQKFSKIKIKSLKTEIIINYIIYYDVGKIIKNYNNHIYKITHVFYYITMDIIKNINICDCFINLVISHLNFNKFNNFNFTIKNTKKLKLIFFNINNNKLKNKSFLNNLPNTIKELQIVHSNIFNLRLNYIAPVNILHISVLKNLNNLQNNLYYLNIERKINIKKIPYNLISLKINNTSIKLVKSLNKKKMCIK